MDDTSACVPFQPSLRLESGTRTALGALVEDFHSKLDKVESPLLISFYPSRAFDTVNISIVFYWMEHGVGINGVALCAFFLSKWTEKQNHLGGICLAACQRVLFFHL